MQTEPSMRHPSTAATGWPTTLRFSRRLGEALRGPDYAAAFEGTDSPSPVHFELRAGQRHRAPSLVALLLRAPAKAE